MIIICISQVWSYLPSDSQSQGVIIGLPFQLEKSNFASFQRLWLNFSFFTNLQGLENGRSFSPNCQRLSKTTRTSSKMVWVHQTWHKAEEKTYSMINRRWNLWKLGFSEEGTLISASKTQAHSLCLSLYVSFRILYIQLFSVLFIFKIANRIINATYSDSLLCMY